MLKDFRLGYPAVIAALEAMNPQPTPAQPVVPQRVPLTPSEEGERYVNDLYETRDLPVPEPVLQYREPAYVPEWARPPEVTFEVRLTGGDCRPEGGIRPLVYGSPGYPTPMEHVAVDLGHTSYTVTFQHVAEQVESIATSDVPEGATHLQLLGPDGHALPQHMAGKTFYRCGPWKRAEWWLYGGWRESGWLNDELTGKHFQPLTQPTAPTEWQSGPPPSVGWREIRADGTDVGYHAFWTGEHWCANRTKDSTVAERRTSLGYETGYQTEWRGPRLVGDAWPEPQSEEVPSANLCCDAQAEAWTRNGDSFEGPWLEVMRAFGLSRNEFNAWDLERILPLERRAAFIAAMNAI